eukprot:g1551.t1
MFSTSRSARRWAALTVLQQMIGFLQMSTMLMPSLITLAMCFSFFLTLTWDMIFSEEIFKELIFWLYGHWEDPCDQPIGHLQQCFWIVFWIKVFILVSYAKYEEERPLDHRSLSVRLFQYLLKPLAVAFEVCWPTVTFISLRKTNAEGCSKILRQTGWLLLAPYFLEVFVALFSMLWPGLKRLLPKPDTDLAREFRDVQFVAEVGRSVTTCSISTYERLATLAPVCGSCLEPLVSGFLQDATFRQELQDGCLIQ